MGLQAEEARLRDIGAEVAERDRRSSELRTQLENDAAILRRAQKAVDAERAAQKVCRKRIFGLLHTFEGCLCLLCNLVHA